MSIDKFVNVNITFRNLEGTESIKNYAVEKITHCLQKFIHHDTEVHLVLQVERLRHIADVNFKFEGSSINAKEDSTDMYASIDALVDNLSQQLRKHKEKLTEKHK